MLWPAEANLPPSKPFVTFVDPFSIKNGSGINEAGRHESLLDLIKGFQHKNPTIQAYKLFNDQTPSETKKKLIFLTNEAEKQNNIAQNTLGLMYLDGKVVQQDYKKAFKLFNDSARQGNPYALYNLSRMYYEGLGVKFDEEKAFLYLKESVEKGNAPALPDLGRAYLYGRGVSSSNKEAIKCYRRAIELDEMTPDGYYHFMKETQDDTTISDEERLDFIQRATTGQVDAYELLYQYYLDHGDQKQAKESLEKGIKHGSPECLFQRGILRRDGRFVSKNAIYEFDPIGGLQDLEKAEEKGCGRAAFILSLIYDSHKDPEKWSKYNKRAQELNQIETYYELKRTLLSLNDQRALSLPQESLEFAANHGNIDAMSTLYIKGLETGLEPEKCISLLSKMLEKQPEKWNLHYEMYYQYDRLAKQLGAQKPFQTQNLEVLKFRDLAWEHLNKAAEFNQREISSKFKKVWHFEFSVGEIPGIAESQIGDQFATRSSKFWQAKQDFQIAYHWYELSSKSHPFGYLRLAEMNLRGCGCKQDFKKALELWKRGIYGGAIATSEQYHNFISSLCPKTRDEKKLLYGFFNDITASGLPTEEPAVESVIWFLKNRITPTLDSRISIDQFQSRLNSLRSRESLVSTQSGVL